MIMKYYKIAIKILYVFLLALILLPQYGIVLSEGLDSSRIWGLNIVNSKKLIFGKDLFTQYGPLSFMTETINILHNFKVASLFFGILLLVVMSVFIRVIFIDRYNFKVMLLSLLFLFLSSISSEYFIIYTFMLCLSYVILSTGKLQYVYLGFIIALMTLCFYINFVIGGVMFITLLAWLLFDYFFIGEKSLKMMIMTLISPIIFIVTFTVYSTDISACIGYINGVLSASYGLSEAMSLSDNGEMLRLALIIGIFYYYFTVNKGVVNKSQGFYLLLFSGFIFLSFKNSFVRSDNHIEIFFNFFLMILSIIVVFIDRFDISNNNAKMVNFKSNYVIFAIIVLCTMMGVNININERVNQITSKFENITNFNEQSVAMLNRENNYLRISDEILDTVGNDTITIYPTSLMLAAYNKLNYVPMPTLQVFSAYTPHLDDLNANFFNGKDAPKYILLSNDTIDGRLPYLEAPRTFEAILTRYYTVSIDSDRQVALLALKDFPDEATRNLIYKNSFGISDSIEIPDNRNVFGNYVTAQFDMKLNLLGKLMKTFAKIPPIEMTLFNADGDVINKGRIIPSNLNMEGGIIVNGSTYMETLSDFMFLTNYHLTDTNVETIKFSGEGLKYYKQQVDVAFYQLGLKNGNKDYPYESVKGEIALDLNSLKTYSETPLIVIDKVVVNYDTILEISGWAATSSGDNMSVYLKIDDHIFPTDSIERLDVAQHENFVDTESVEYGFVTLVDLSTIGDLSNKNVISLIYISRDQQWYGEYNVKFEF